MRLSRSAVRANSVTRFTMVKSTHFTFSRFSFEFHSRSACMPQPLGQGARSLPRNVHEPRVFRNLLQQWENFLRLRQHSLAHIGVQLQQRVVHSQAVVLHPSLYQFNQLLLPRQPFTNLQQLRRIAVQRVVELGLVTFRPILPTKSFLSQIGNLSVYVQIDTLEMILLVDQFENLAAQCSAHFEGTRSRVFLQLPDFITRAI